jgi:2-polyprenyl-3-methyl-5-hydroxy-6-metoxy-1,4-benzoquinol methylase
MLRSAPLTPEQIQRIAVRYPTAGAWDRFHVRHRLRLCPYDELLPHLPERGTLLDVGCGFGLLGWFLAEARPALEYWGADIDARKVALARLAFQRHPAGDRADHLHAGEVADWRERPALFNAVTVLDVLYLLPLTLQRALFDFCCRALEPRGRLLLKILPRMRGRDRLRTWAQESLMVHVLRKTQGSGAIFASQDPGLYSGWAAERGLACREHPLPTTPPSTLLVVERRDV